jgi:methionine aminotransferase
MNISSEAPLSGASKARSRAGAPESRLPAVSGSIFAEMSRLAAEFDAINLAQGYPDFAPDEVLLTALESVLRGNHHQYSLPEGARPLRQGIGEMFETLYGCRADPDSEITITAGATQAIFATISSLIHAGDEVIYMAPAFECYAPAIILAGGVPSCVQLRAPGFGIDWNHVESLVTPRTRMIIVNSPHNPSGRCWDSSDLDSLADIAERHDILVLCDEVYHNITYAGRRHLTALGHPRLRDRSIVVGSLGKTMHVTGWRIGYAIGAAGMTSELRKILLFNTYSAPTPLQQAMATTLASRDSYLGLPVLFQRKRDMLVDGLRASRFRFEATEGTYFQMLDYAAISDVPDVDFVRFLATTHGVAAIPLSGFGKAYRDSRLIRLCFAKQDRTLVNATELLAKV